VVFLFDSVLEKAVQYLAAAAGGSFHLWGVLSLSLGYTEMAGRSSEKQLNGGQNKTIPTQRILRQCASAVAALCLAPRSLFLEIASVLVRFNHVAC
jgi:hypothetical protein